MGETPNPLNRRRLTRASLAGAGLGFGGVVLFIILWIALGRSGVDQFPRLIISICLPPALIALAAGLFVLFVQPRNGH